MTKRGSHPIDQLFERADMRCTVCGARMADGCNCWSKCECGWLYLTGKGPDDCRNPVHRVNGEKVQPSIE